MTTVFEFLRSDIASDMSVALLHTLWQGLVITAVLYLALKAIPSKQSLWRYRFSIISLLAVVLCWLATFSILQYEPPQKSQNVAISAKMSPHVDAPAAAGNVKPVEPVATTVTIHQPADKAVDTESANFGIGYLIVLWSVGVVVMLVRMFRALAGTARLRRDAVDIEDSSLKELFEKMCKQMNITQKIRFAASKILKHPGVIGFFRPVLLVPVSMLTELPADHLQAIIAHELAHIRRYDYLVNFCQMLIEAIFFFNPAVWWISRQIRIEREVCCDAAGIETTGKPIQYAKILFDQLTRCSRSPKPAMTAAITGFSDDTSSNSAERVKRIIHPNHKPQMRIGWIKLALLIAIASATIVGIWKTADATVSIAAKILTPKERIEKMAELDEDYGEPAFDPNGSSALPEDDKITVSGTIKTWDGKKVHHYAHMTIHIQNGRSGASIGISPDFGSSKWVWDGNTGIFSNKCEYDGQVYIIVSSEGYTPACAGPFKVKKGQKKEGIEIMLGKGFPASVQVVDADTQKPISDVELSGGYEFRADSCGYSIKLKTGKDGKAIVEHAGETNVTFRAHAKGYQKQNFEKQKLIKDGTLVLKMKKADPAEGVVVSQKTGQPVANAVIRIQKQLGKHRSSSGRDQGDILATTDEKGRFTLDQIPEETTYILSVKADGYAYAFTDEIEPGQKNIQIKLDTPIVIKGRLTGPLDRLPERKGKQYVPYSCSFSRDNHSYSETGQQAYVTIDGEEATFEATNLWGTGVNIGMKHWRKHVKFNDQIPDEIVLDLGDPLTEDGKKYHTRKLILQFDTPKGSAPPTGTIRINYMDPAHSSTTSKGKLLEIIDGKAQADIVAPGKISYKVADTLGYWFKEINAQPVDGSDEPMVIKVPVVPAGMIFGEVFNEDGTPAVNTMVGYNIVKKSPLLDKSSHFLGVDGKDSTSSGETETKYGIKPLPLQGVYRIIAHRKSTYVVSEPIKLTEKKPIHRVNLTLPKGVTVAGQITSPDGSPAQGIKYVLSFEPDGGHSFGVQSKYTDAQGRFQIEHVNQDVEGKYYYRIHSDRNYRPYQMQLKKLTKPIKIKLEKGAVATGQIIDKETGWPIPSAEVSAYYHNYREDNSEYEQVKAEAKTDKNGRFRFSNLKHGREYNFIVRSCSYSSFSITGGKTKDQAFKVTPSKWSKLKPRKPNK